MQTSFYILFVLYTKVLFNKGFETYRQNFIKIAEYFLLLLLFVCRFCYYYKLIDTPELYKMLLKVSYINSLSLGNKIIINNSMNINFSNALCFTLSISLIKFLKLFARSPRISHIILSASCYSTYLDPENARKSRL